MIEANTAKLNVFDETAKNLITAKSNLADTDIGESTTELRTAELHAQATIYSIQQSNEIGEAALSGIIGVVDEYA